MKKIVLLLTINLILFFILATLALGIYTVSVTPESPFPFFKKLKSNLLYNYGSLFSSKSSTEEFYKSIIALNPKNPAPYVELGYLYLEEQQFDNALESFKKAISLNPTEYKYLDLVLAETYYGAKDYQNALKYAEKAIVTYPQDYYAYYWKGEIYKAMKAPNKAIKAYNKALTFYPNDFITMQSLADLYDKQKDDQEKAFYYYKQVKDTYNYSFTTNDWLIDYYSRQKDYKNALELVELMITYYPKDKKYLEKKNELEKQLLKVERGMKK